MERAPPQQPGWINREAEAAVSFREDDGGRCAAYAGSVSALYAWLTRHPMLVDGVLAFGLAILGLGAALKVGPELRLPLLAAITVPVAFRRRYPVQAFAVSGCALAVDLLTGGGPGGSLLATLVLLYTLAAYRPRRISIPGLLVSVAGAWAVVVVRVGSSVGGLNLVLLALVISSGTALVAWVLGDSMRYRRAYLRELEDRAARLERERGTQAQIAAAAERARIARELHDVIAHNVSVMVVQADGAGRDRADRAAGPDRDAAAARRAAFRRRAVRPGARARSRPDPRADRSGPGRGHVGVADALRSAPAAVRGRRTRGVPGGAGIADEHAQARRAGGRRRGRRRSSAAAARPARSSW
jgi:heme exporter protein D